MLEFLSLSFGGFLTSIILFVNSVVILNQERLLTHLGISYDTKNADNENNKTIRGRLSWFFYRTQDLMTYPLILLNVLAIVFLLIFGLNDMDLIFYLNSMPSLKRAFSTTSIFLFTLGIIGIILPSTVFIYARNSMHFIPMGVKLILSLGICGGIIAVITSMIGIYGGFSIQKILLYIYIGGVALTALLFFSATVVSFIGTVSTDGSLYFFWKNLSSDQKAFTEVAFRCCGWKSYASTGCAYYPIVGETQVACYSKLYFPYLAFIFVSLIFGSLATVMCITFIGIVVYFLFNFGPAKIKETYSAEEEEATDDYGDDSTNDL